MLQLELGEEIESNLKSAASTQGVTVDRFVRDRLLFLIPNTVDGETMARRVEAARELKTFAKDRGIRLPPGVTVEDLLNEVRR